MLIGAVETQLVQNKGGETGELQYKYSQYALCWKLHNTTMFLKCPEVGAPPLDIDLLQRV